jgi:hypothetical protein
MALLDIETLVLSSSESWPGLREASQTLLKHLARARYVDVPGGAGHSIPPKPRQKHWTPSSMRKPVPHTWSVSHQRGRPHTAMR